MESKFCKICGTPFPVTNDLKQDEEFCIKHREIPN